MENLDNVIRPRNDQVSQSRFIESNKTFNENEYVIHEDYGLGRYSGLEIVEADNKLNEYINVWSLIDSIWHLKPLKFEFMNIWKANQEKEMYLKKGNALQDEKLSNFLRMLNVSIPQKSFDFINSYALLLLDQERNLVQAGLNL